MLSFYWIYKNWESKTQQISFRKNKEHTCLRYLRTACERISSKSRQTATYRIMIYNSTVSVQSTSTRAWIYTFLVFTCKVLRAFWTYNAFRFTHRRWTNITWWTWTYSLIVYSTTLTVWSTWWRLTWESWFSFCCLKKGIIKKYYFSKTMNNFKFVTERFLRFKT